MVTESIISKIFKTRIPKDLYHYTSSAGLHGIIKDGNLWTTKIHYLNDSSEWQLALRYIREEIDIQRKNDNRTRSIEELDCMIDELDSVEKINVSVASFTAKGNQLSQWRGYCKIGDGYSIGFDGRKLREKVKKDIYHNYLVPCIYKEKEHRTLVSELVNFAHVIGRPVPITPTTDGLQYLRMMDFNRAALLVAPMIKAEGFYQESEWRLISRPLDYSEAEFRCGKYSMIPYWKFDLDLENTLKEIFIGPTPEPDLSSVAVSGLLKKLSLLI